MATNKWLCLGYIDDGCYRYKCLACQNRWESRTEAEDWHFCPYCGVRWIGTAGATSDDRLGPRRRRNWEAMRREWRPDKPSPFIWVIETRTRWEGNPPHGWEFHSRLGRGWWVSAMEAYRALQQVRADCTHYTTEANGKIVWECRIRALRGPG
jgi:DNA-directed RNA polymerase subunit RPC12/RpoP